MTSWGLDNAGDQGLTSVIADGLDKFGSLQQLSICKCKVGVGWGGGGA